MMDEVRHRWARRESGVEQQRQQAVAQLDELARRQYAIIAKAEQEGNLRVRVAASKNLIALSVHRAQLLGLEAPKRIAIDETVSVADERRAVLALIQASAGPDTVGAATPTRMCGSISATAPAPASSAISCGTKRAARAAARADLGSEPHQRAQRS
jgi:hypothetical protein